MLDYTYSDKKLWRLFTSLFQFFSYRKLSSFNEREKNRIKRLREMTNFYYELKDISQSETAWMQIGNEVNLLIQENDPREFYKWKCIQDSMAVSNSEFIVEEYKRLKKSPNWEQKYKHLLSEPDRFYFPSFLFNKKCSGNTIHHSYLISLFENTTGVNISDYDIIVEFGGGYGNLCRLIHMNGFNGKYIIYDLPTFTFLQEFFLNLSSLNAIQIDASNWTEYPLNYIFCTTKSKEITEYIELQDSDKKILFIGTWSLSESPISIRHQFRNVFQRSNAFLFAYQDLFGEVNNRLYFKEITQQKECLKWNFQQIDYLKNHNLLFGTT